MTMKEMAFELREAIPSDREFVIELMETALSPYYGGDHRAHAERIFSTHISGGKDHVGHFSFEQKMFVITVDHSPAGIVHLVAKRQGTCKISPLIVAPDFRGKAGLGSALLAHAEQFASARNARQIYCTVARENHHALQFFQRHGFIAAGYSDSHYKQDITEVMLYKPLVPLHYDHDFDRPHISVVPLEEKYESQVRRLLIERLSPSFDGINDDWVDALFAGYTRRQSGDINQKYKLIFVAADRQEHALGVAGATPKKGEPIKLMPFVATSLPAFYALLSDLPFILKRYGRKIYIHIEPTADETLALQQRGWRLDAAMPSAYRLDHLTQQWSLDLQGNNLMRQMRVKQQFLQLISKGVKTLEVRVGYDNINTIQPGERVRFVSRAHEQVVLVRAIRRYGSFDEMLEHEDPQAIAPGEDKESVAALLKGIYPPQREKLGVVVLQVVPQRDLPA